MLPIRDTIPSRRRPVMTWLLILINLGIFFYQKTLEPETYKNLIMIFGLIPARAAQVTLQNGWGIIPLFSYMFLHGGWLHVISNMWALWLFGDNVEDKMGAGRFFLFYILMGIVAGLVHVMADSGSNLPTIGASGAISGIMGAYFIMFPKAKIVTLVPLFIIPFFIEIPAMIYLAFWLISQVYSAVMTGNTGDVGNIAWWAHIGGFAAGIVFHGFFFRKYQSKYHF